MSTNYTAQDRRQASAAGEDDIRVFAGVDLFTDELTETAIYYEWLLDLVPGPRPGEALKHIGVQVLAPESDQATPNDWVPSFRVDSVASATAVAIRQGAKKREVIAGGATRSYIEDSGGVWTGLTVNMRSSDVDRRINVDYSALDIDAAGRLYGAVLAVDRMDMIDDPYDMRFLYASRKVVAGVLRLHGVAGFSLRPYWIVYFEVADVATHADRAAGSGSRVIIPPARSPFNTYAVLEDPWGRIFGISELRRDPDAPALPVRLASHRIGALADLVDLY